MYSGHKYVKALSGFEEYLAVNPDSMSALNMIGGIHLLLGDKEKAEKTYFKLADRLMSRGEHDKALAVLTRLSAFSRNKAKIFNLRCDIYRLKGKNRLADRQLLMLAEEYRHSGNFSECIAIYTSLADKNRDDHRLIRSLVHKLIIINGYSTIAMILKNSVENELFPVGEIDDIIMFLLESKVKPEYVIPFIKDFLTRHPDYFYKAEPVLIQSFRAGFDSELFADIIDLIDISDASDFVQALREFLDNRELLLHSLLIEAYSDNRDMIKGMIFELYVNNSLEMGDIAEVSVKAGNPAPIEEALKLVAKAVEEPDMMRCLGVMESLYRSKDSSARADELAVYLKYGRKPENIASLLASEPESPADLESRFRSAEENDDGPEVSEKTDDIPVNEMVIEPHSYEDEGSQVKIDALELDTYNETFGESKIAADIMLSDDYRSPEAVVPPDIFDGFDITDEPVQSSVFEGFDTPAESGGGTDAIVFSDDELRDVSKKTDEEDFFSKEVDG